MKMLILTGLLCALAYLAGGALMASANESAIGAHKNQVEAASEQLLAK